MLPGLNFNPSFANLAALHGLGGMPHPIRPVAPISFGPQIEAPSQMGAPGCPAMAPQQPQMPMQSPYGVPAVQAGHLNNLRAILQLLGQR